MDSVKSSVGSSGERLDRPCWDEYFLTIALEVRRRSTCLRRQVGAVLVKEKRILATGYNGAPRHIRHCSEVGCLREKKGVPSGERHELCRGLHAEMNALLQAALYGITVKGATIYTTSSPCSLCAKMLINADVERVVCLEDYADDLAAEMFEEAGIRVEVRERGQDASR